LGEVIAGMTEPISTRWHRAVGSGAVRHYGGFLLAGLSALATDAAVLTMLTRWFGISPFIARLFGIALAMVVSWLINRTITFSAATPPTLVEFSKFAGVSVTSQIVNYAVFAGLLLAIPALLPELALFFACFVSMFVSYAGFRFGVFGQSRQSPREPHS
jgi:putative flippase GtrA